MKKFEFANQTELVNYVKGQANILLDKCRIYGDADDREGLVTDIEMCHKAKSDFWKIFEKSPYHNGKGQLIIPMEIERPVDEDVIYDFSEYILEIAERYLMTEARIDEYTYYEAYQEKEQIERFIRAIDYMRIEDDDVIIKGKQFSEYRSKYSQLTTIISNFDNKYYYLGNRRYTEYENREKYDKARVIAKAIEHCVGHVLENEYDIEKLAKAFPHSQCRAGVKISRCVQKCLKELGLYDIVMENERDIFNRMYARWCDAVSPRTVTKWSVLSINFVDYLSMSHGDTWTSCLNTDKDGYFTEGMWCDGFNSKRTLDYALDETTMVFYTIDANYEGDDWELQPKCTRQLFHFGEGKLVQSRLYPQANTARRSIYDQYRNNVEFLLADAMGEANLWSAPIRGEIEYDGNVVNTPYEYSSHGNFIDFLDVACHGDEENDFQDEVNYVVFRGSNNREDNGVPMIVGSIGSVCIICGKPFNEEDRDSIKCCKIRRN